MQQAQRLFARLSEAEKIQLRGATVGGLEHLGETFHRSDLPDLTLDERAAILVEVQALCFLEATTIRAGQARS